MFQLYVTAAGTVGEVRILQLPCKRLEQSAVTAVRQWKYEPVRLNGQPVPFSIGVVVPFRLPSRFKGRAGRNGACKWTEPPQPVR